MDDNKLFQLIMTQGDDLHSQILREFGAVKYCVDYIGSWVGDFHNPSVYESEDEKQKLLETFTQIKHLLEDLD